MTTEGRYIAVKRLLRDCPDILTPIWLHFSKNDVYASINEGRTKNEYALLRKQYPHVLCVDQARQNLHVSKRKMVRMPEHGYVAYTDNGRKHGSTASSSKALSTT